MCLVCARLVACRSSILSRVTTPCALRPHPLTKPVIEPLSCVNMPRLRTAGCLPLVHTVPHYDSVRVKASSAHETHHRPTFVREYALSAHGRSLATHPSCPRYDSVRVKASSAHETHHWPTFVRECALSAHGRSLAARPSCPRYDSVRVKASSAHETHH